MTGLWLVFKQSRQGPFCCVFNVQRCNNISTASSAGRNMLSHLAKLVQPFFTHMTNSLHLLPVHDW
jgi:hypothetical protein